MRKTKLIPYLGKRIATIERRIKQLGSSLDPELKRNLDKQIEIMEAIRADARDGEIEC